MFNKKYFLILLLLIVGICAISAASAADVSDAIASDNATDVVADDDANAVVIAADSNDDVIAANVNEDLEKNDKKSNDEIIAASQDDSKLSKDQSSDERSVLIVIPTHADDYSVKFIYNPYNLQGSHNVKDIQVKVKSTKTGVYDNPYIYNYDFSLRIYDSVTKNGNGYTWGNKIWDSGRINGFDITTEEIYHIYVPAKTFQAGKYYLGLFNYYDDALMCSPSSLKVKDDAIISVDNYNANYNSGKKMTIKLNDKKTNAGIKGTIKVTFSNGLVKYYTTDKNGQVSFVPPLNSIGVYSATFSPANEYLTVDSVKKAVTIKKSKVVVKAQRVSQYKGYKITLKATVKSYGQKVREGKVVFKIKGKKYYAKVKNGVAVKKLKLRKVNKYRYSATFLGTKNFFKSKKSLSRAIIKQTYRVKIYAPNPSLYVGQKKYCTIKVRTADGKRVKSGWLKIQDTNGYSKAKVKNGNVKVLAYANLADVYVKSQGDDSIYKKSVTKKFKIKYIPTSHKYKRASTVYKGTSKFKCHCGKTYTHSHSYMDYYYFIHYYTIYVIG